MRRLEKKDIIFVQIIEFVLRPIVFVLDLFKKKPEPKDFNYIKKILVVEFWHLGDLVMITAPIKGLKKKFPNARIDLVASRKAEVLLEHNPDIDKIIPFEAPWVKHKYNILTYDLKTFFNLFKKLRKESYDLAIAYRGDFRDNFFIYSCGAKRRVGYSFAGGSSLLTDRVSLNYNKPHHVDQLLEIDKYLGIDIFGLKPELYVTRKESEEIDKLLLGKGISKKDFLTVIHPGARSRFRLWETARFAEVADYLIAKQKKKVVIVCSTEQNQLGEAILNSVKNRGTLFFKNLSLRQLIALYKRCELAIGLDTGPIHIASGVGTPVIALFGPQRPEWYRPYGVDNIVVNSDMPCIPCRQKTCFVKPTCMERISTQQVIEAVDTLLARITQKNTTKYP